MSSPRDTAVVWTVSLIIAAAMMFAVAAALTPKADAHHVSASSASARILATGYGGQCGKGTWTRCIYQAAPMVAPTGRHSYTFLGYYQERKLLHPLRQCRVAGWVFHQGAVMVTWKSCS